MSLNIYFNEVDKLPALPVMYDALEAFISVSITGCDYDRRMIQNIEEGSYLDSSFFIDRFGSKVRIDNLSMGTKIALSLYHLPDIVINGVELGANALTEIVRYCTVGNLLLPERNFYVAGKVSDIPIIDVVCKGRRYMSLNEFAEYMMEDAPYD